MLKKIISLCACTSLFLLAGCQTTTVDSNSLDVAPLEILTKESQKAVLAQQALKNAQKWQMETLSIRQSKFNVDIININYIGTPEVLLNSVASHYGYRYLENGPQRTLPIVNFTDRKETGFELVKDISIFLGKSANITVDNQNKTIVLTYLP